MKKNYEYSVGNKKIVREITYIPGRYVLAMIVSVLEIIAILAIVIGLCIYLPLFYLAALVTQICCIIHIVASDVNPDYKIPWLICILILPVIGFMLYFLFSSRKLKPKYVKRLKLLKNKSYENDHSEIIEKMEKENLAAANQARMIAKISESHVFINTKVQYFPTGESAFSSMISDLKRAEKFIFLEYFIIEEGKLWNSILEVLKEKAAAGVDVKLVYDDIGCMTTLPGNYSKKLKAHRIDATPFSRLKGGADSEFNNRNHRKITVIDGYIGYTGGVNIADEYVNEKVRFGHWKDNAVRLEGEAVKELSKLFLIDYGINVKYVPEYKYDCFPSVKAQTDGYVLPFGDGPFPLYTHRVGKSLIQNMLASATRYVYITTPYLIIDNDLCQDIENTAMRGVDVRIVVPHIPDKKLIFEMTKSFYNRLLGAGVKIYEYEPGFIHAKTYVVDDEYAMVGTINLDYRSLVHHFENGVWLCGCSAIKDIKADVLDTISKSIEVDEEMKKTGKFKKFIRAIFRLFAPLM